ncbi:MAG: hypothetical protein ABSA44_09670 [Bacteroidota bacterium]|jgi:hypothetical protein
MERRTFLLGRKVELEKNLKALKVEITTTADAIMLHFSLHDLDQHYVDELDTEAVQILLNMVARKKKIYSDTKKELETVNRELGV